MAADAHPPLPSLTQTSRMDKEDLTPIPTKAPRSSALRKAAVVAVVGAAALGGLASTSSPLSLFSLAPSAVDRELLNKASCPVQVAPLNSSGFNWVSPVEPAANDASGADRRRSAVPSSDTAGRRGVPEAGHRPSLSCRPDPSRVLRLLPEGHQSRGPDLGWAHQDERLPGRGVPDCVSSCSLSSSERTCKLIHLRRSQSGGARGRDGQHLCSPLHLEGFQA